MAKPDNPPGNPDKGKPDGHSADGAITGARPQLAGTAACVPGERSIVGRVYHAMIYVTAGYVTDGYIAQTLAPIADIGVSAWLPSSGSDRYATMDEYPPNDADYAYSPDNPTTERMEILHGPATGGTHTACTSAVRLQATGGNLDFDINLMQGATVLDSWTETVTTGAGVVLREHESTGLLITNPSDLRLRYATRISDTVVVAGFTAADIIDAMDTAFLAAPKKSVTFPAGTYALGSYSTAQTIFDLSGYGDGLVFLAEGAGPNFIIDVTGTAPVEIIIFAIAGQSNVAFHGVWSFEDLSGDYYPTISLHKGAHAFIVGAYCTNISIDQIDTLNIYRAFAALTNVVPGEPGEIATHAPGTSEYITIDAINSIGTMYSFTLANQGSHSSVGLITAVNGGRSFFVYGVDDVQGAVIQTDPQAGRTSIIKHYGGLNTTNITLTLSDLRNWGAAGTVIDVDQANDMGTDAILDNIEINITATFRDPVPTIQGGGYDFAMVAFNSFDGTETLIGSSDQIWSDITVNGSRTTHYPWLVRPSFTTLSPTGTLNYPTGEAVHTRLPSEFTITYI